LGLNEGAPLAEAMLPVLHRVQSRQEPVPGVVTLILEAQDTEPMRFGPGQFNMLWAYGVGEAAISISGDPANGELAHTIREVGATTRALCRLEVGEVLGVRGPFGNGWEIGDGRGADVVMVAGGLGLAPLRPAALAVAADRGSYGRALLLVGVRSPEQLVFGPDLDRLHAAGIEVQVIVDRAAPGWSGRVGLVTELVQRADFDPSNALALVCGPEAMMRFTARALVDRGVAPARIRVSMERNMKCAIGLCGHCQLGPDFICREGPVLNFDRMAPLMAIREL